jgi:hypothetical protein
VLRLALIVTALAACQTKTEKAPAPTPVPTPEVKPEPVAPPPAPVVDLATFAKDCKEATDCVVVKRAWCDPCGCAMDAIASKEMAKFDEAADKLACPRISIARWHAVAARSSSPRVRTVSA